MILDCHKSVAISRVLLAGVEAFCGFGQKLTISAVPAAAGTAVLEIDYSTSGDPAVTWLSSEQTAPGGRGANDLRYGTGLPQPLGVLVPGHTAACAPRLRPVFASRHSGHPDLVVACAVAATVGPVAPDFADLTAARRTHRSGVRAAELWGPSRGAASWGRTRRRSA